jgi:hypothetical protein
MTYEDALRATAEWMQSHVPDGYNEIGVHPADDYLEDAAELLKVIGYEAMWGRVLTLREELDGRSVVGEFALLGSRPDAQGTESSS